MDYLSLVGIVLSILLYTILAWKGHNQFVCVFFAIIVVIITSQLAPYEAYAEYWMSGFVGYIMGYALVFVAGAVFGKFLEVSGATETIAKLVLRAGPKYAYAVLILVITFLTFNGISPWAAIFFIGPITLTVLRKSGIPRRFSPAILYFGSCTLAYVIPGCTKMTNYMACTLMDVPLMAAAPAGFITVAFTFVVGCMLLRFMVKRAVAKGEGFTERAGDTFANVEEGGESKCPPVWLVLIPMLGCVIACNVMPTFGLHVETGFLIGILLCIVCLRNYIDLSQTKKYLKESVPGGFDMVIMLGTVYGFGTVIVQTPAYALIQDLVLNIPGSPLVGVAVAVNVIAGATGSGTSGINIVLPALGASWVAKGASPAAIARVASFSSTALDSLPHNSGVVSMIDNMGETHGTAYLPIFFMTVLLPILATAFCVTIMTIFPILAM